MRTWRVAFYPGEICGAKGCRIPEGQPLQEIALRGVTAKRVRCEACADGPIDWAAIDAAKQAREAEAAAEAPLTPSQYAARASASTTRVTPHRQPTGFHSMRQLGHVPFDPKLAAAGDRDS